MNVTLSQGHKLVTSIPEDDGFYYLFDTGYESAFISSPDKGIHLMAHISQKSWVTVEHMKALAVRLADDLDCWR